MKKLTLGNETIHISKNCFWDIERRFKEKPAEKSVIEKIVEKTSLDFGMISIANNSSDVYGKSYFLKFCKNILGLQAEPNIGVLYARGFYEKEQWIYYETVFKKRKVDGWINKNDGVYDVLIIHSDNKGALRPVVQKSIVIIPQGSVSSIQGHEGENLIVIPGRGAIPFNRMKLERVNFDFNNLLEKIERYP